MPSCFEDKALFTVSLHISFLPTCSVQHLKTGIDVSENGTFTDNLDDTWVKLNSDGCIMAEALLL